LSPFLRSLIEAHGEDVRIDRGEYDRRCAGIEKFHAKRGIGGSTRNRKLSVAVGSRNDTLARDNHVRMTKVANVSQINREVVHPDVHYVDSVDRRYRIDIVDALAGFEQNMNRCRPIGRRH
jgi:hypothetical protein